MNYTACQRFPHGPAGPSFRQATPANPGQNGLPQRRRAAEVIGRPQTRPAGVKNTATAFGLLLDAVEKHLDELDGNSPDTPA